MAANKVIINNATVIDLTADTVAPEYLYVGIVAHSASGSTIVGSLKDGDNIAYGEVGGMAIVGTAVVGTSVAA